nr:glycine C-acetyltransferase [Candidatus Cloacimonadota bacterium]
MAYSIALQKRYRDILNDIQDQGLNKEEVQITGLQGAEIHIKSSDNSGEARKINMCSNNYLGLAAHPDILKAAHEALDRRGYGMASVRFICGTQDTHKELEQRMSTFLGTEDCILFSSCFDANAAVFETLMMEEDIMISDRLVHASIIDGMRLSRASHDTYKHSDMLHLEKKLQMYHDRHGKIIVTDGVFSMDGDIAKLQTIVDLAEKHNAMVFLDDSHATGFLGENGRGSHELCGVFGKIDLITTTFGKALGGASGGCVAGRKDLVELLRQRGRPYLFSNSLAPMMTITTLQALNLIEQDDSLRKKLKQNMQWWRKELVAAGFIVVPGESPIVPIMLYDAVLAQEFAKRLFAEGVHAVAFSFPVVPKNQARIRTQLSAAHNPEHLEIALAKFIKVGKELDILGKSKEELLSMHNK